MPSRLSAALRELAEALEDAEADHWTVVTEGLRAAARKSPSPPRTSRASESLSKRHVKHWSSTSSSTHRGADKQ